MNITNNAIELWIYYKDTHGEFWIKSKEDGRTVVFTDNEDDAKIIAAAPELLEALKSMMRYNGIDINEPIHINHSAVTNQALTAIKKAIE